MFLQQVCSTCSDVGEVGHAVHEEIAVVEHCEDLCKVTGKVHINVEEQTQLL